MPTDDIAARAEGRADFLRRFFAVAIGVGYANNLVKMRFLTRGDFSNPNDLIEVTLLVFSVVVVMGSWDFYFTAIKAKPLYDRKRFYLDITIVSCYIVLLSSIGEPRTFCIILTGILFLYFLWDVMTAYTFPEKYQLDNNRFSDLFSLYSRGLFNVKTSTQNYSLTPFISLWWLIVFTCIASSNFLMSYSPSLLIIPMICSYIIFRLDQEEPLDLYQRTLMSLLLVAFCFIR